MLHPHCLYLQVQVYLLPSSNQGERISSLHLLHFTQLFCTAAALPLCFYQSKKRVFLLASSCDSLAVILFYFGFFPNYSLLTIFILHPETVSQSTSRERIPSCDNQATSSTTESPLSLFFRKGVSKFSRQVESHPHTPKGGFRFVLRGLTSQLMFQAYLSG